MGIEGGIGRAPKRRAARAVGLPKRPARRPRGRTGSGSAGRARRPRRAATLEGGQLRREDASAPSSTLSTGPASTGQQGDVGREAGGLQPVGQVDGRARPATRGRPPPASARETSRWPRGSCMLYSRSASPVGGAPTAMLGHGDSRRDERVQLPGVEGQLLPGGHQERRTCCATTRSASPPSRSTTPSTACRRPRSSRAGPSRSRRTSSSSSRPPSRSPTASGSRRNPARPSPTSSRPPPPSGDRLGPVLFQLPPNLKKDLDRLRDFLALLPEDAPLRLRVPPRHLGRRRGPRRAARAQLRPGLRRHRDLGRGRGAPIVPTADWGYLRLRRCDYTPAELAPWVDRIRGQPWEQGLRLLQARGRPAPGLGDHPRLQGRAGLTPAGRRSVLVATSSTRPSTR